MDNQNDLIKLVDEHSKCITNNVNMNEVGRK